MHPKWHNEPPTEPGAYVWIYGDDTLSVTRVTEDMLNGTYNSWKNRFVAAYGPIPPRDKVHFPIKIAPKRPPY